MFVTTKAALWWRLILYLWSSESDEVACSEARRANPSRRRHIGLFHKQKIRPSFACRRCQEKFITSEALDSHLRVPPDQICSIREEDDDNSSQSNPEEGITPDIEIKLACRKSTSQIVQWEPLWRVLFPRDDTIPTEGTLMCCLLCPQWSSGVNSIFNHLCLGLVLHPCGYETILIRVVEFEPVMELHEVRKAFADDSERCQSMVYQLATSICTLPGAQPHPKPGGSFWDLFRSFVNQNLKRYNIETACSRFRAVQTGSTSDFDRIYGGSDAGSDHSSLQILPTPRSGNEGLSHVNAGGQNQHFEFSSQASSNSLCSFVPSMTQGSGKAEGTMDLSMAGFSSSETTIPTEAFSSANDVARNAAESPHPDILEACFGLCLTTPCTCSEMFDFDQTRP